MTGIRSPHSRLFEEGMAEHRLALIESLTAGVPADHAAYRQLVGRIEGIDDALKISREADSKLSGEQPDVGA